MRSKSRYESRRRKLALVSLAMVVIVGCGGSGETSPTVTASVPVDATGTTGQVGGPGTSSTGSPTASDLEPCEILTLEDVQEEFPENVQVLASDVDGCLWDSLRSDYKPLTLEVIEAEAEPTGWEPRPIEIAGADWAVVRVDTNETTYEKVLDVLAGGPDGTAHLVPWGDLEGLELGTPEYEALLRLLQIAYDRL
jgi:hypothetical protein